MRRFLLLVAFLAAAAANPPLSRAQNSLPVITAPVTASVQENAFIAITGSASDPDAENVTLSQTNNAPFLSGPASAGPSANPSLTLSGTPNFSQAGSYTIAWSAVDESVPAGSASATTSILVGGPGRNPVIFVVSSATATEGVPFSISASAADPDGDNVTLCVGSKPAFLTGPSCSGPAPNPSLTLSGTPGFTDAGSYAINWSATDSNTGTSTATTALTVANANQPPTLDQPSDMTVSEGETATQQLTATDPDGGALSFSKTGPGPVFLTVSVSGLVTVTPGFADEGNYTATVSVTDGSAIDSKSFAITVVGIDPCPHADAGGPYFGVMLVPVVFDGTGSSDPDGGALSYVWDFGDGATGAGATVSHTYTFRATYSVTLTVEDGICQDSDVTTAEIAEGFTGLAFTTGGNNTTNLASGKPFTCVEVEPVGGSFSIETVDFTTIRMVSPGTGSVSEIPADPGKTSVGGDKNGNGVPEIHACFSKADLRLLFSGLPAGSNQVTVRIEGSLLGGGAFQASLTTTVKATGGALVASISPNPMNPSANVAFSTSKPGAVKVQLFDLQGRLVRTLRQERMASAGYHDVAIDGLTETGKRLASGVYFVKIWTEHEGSITKSLTILK